MRSSKPLALLACIGLTLLTVQTLDSKTGDALDAKVADFGFGLKIAGSYFGSFTPKIDGAQPVPCVFTTNADGGCTAMTAELHGLGNPGLFGKNGVHHMSWTKTGLRETTWKGIVLGFDQNGALGSPLWNGAAYFLVNGVGVFDRKLQTYTGEGFTKGYAFDQDPLDPEAEPVAYYEWSFSFRRINAL